RLTVDSQKVRIAPQSIAQGRQRESASGRQLSTVNCQPTNVHYLLEMRRLARSTELAVTEARRMQAVRCGAARLQAVRVVQHVRCQALPRDDRRGSQGQGTRGLLRLFQAATE